MATAGANGQESKQQTASKDKNETKKQPQQQSQNQNQNENQKETLASSPKEDSIYINKLSNTLFLTTNPRRRNPRLNYFINRARRILRVHETLVVTGVNRAIPMACTLVEFLKRQKVAKVAKIATNMNISPNFGRYGGGVAWGQPEPSVVFHLGRAEHATYVSDYQQRKVIELFETHDPKQTGTVSKKIIEEMNLAQHFLATKEQEEKAKKCLQGGNEVDLPRFIHYCSELIHPLLKDSVFKEKLAALGINTTDSKPAPEE